MDLKTTTLFNGFYEHIVALKLPITANSVEVIAKRLIILGFLNWDKSTATTAKLLSLGLDDLPDEDPGGILIFEKGGWDIYSVIDDYNRFFVRNISKGLTLGYPSLTTFLKYKEFQVNPMRANRDTASVLEDVKAIINGISGN